MPRKTPHDCDAIVGIMTLASSIVGVVNLIAGVVCIVLTIATALAFEWYYEKKG
jgi:hypothetical protein